AWQYGREIAPGFTAVGRGSWLDLQLRFPGSVPWIQVDSVADLPDAAEKGTVAVVGDCAALYRSSGEVWRLVTSGEAGGSTRVRVRSDAPLVQPIVIATTRAEAGTIKLSLVAVSGDKAALEFPGTLVASRADFDLQTSGDGGFDVELDLIHDTLEN